MLSPQASDDEVTVVPALVASRAVEHSLLNRVPSRNR